MLGIKLLIVGFFLALVISLAGLTYYLLGGDEETQATASVTNDENLFILSPDQVVDVYDGDTFKIDLPSMHPLFGDDLSIRLFGLDTPEMRGTKDEVKALAMQSPSGAKDVYDNKIMKNHHGGVIKIGDHVYGFSEGYGWVCQNFKTGELVWNEKKALGKGAIAYADGRFYCLGEGDGIVILIETTPKG